MNKQIQEIKRVFEWYIKIGCRGHDNLDDEQIQFLLDTIDQLKREKYEAKEEARSERVNTEDIVQEREELIIENEQLRTQLDIEISKNDWAQACEDQHLRNVMQIKGLFEQLEQAKEAFNVIYNIADEDFQSHNQLDLIKATASDTLSQLGKEDKHE